MAFLDPSSIKLLQARDEVFLKKVFQEINPYLLKILASNRIFHESADELVQEAWRIFFENLDKFRGQSQIRTFLAGILINKIREHRRFGKKILVEEDHDKIFAQAFTKDGWWVTDPHDPQELMQSKQVMLFIYDCLEGLTEAQREAFALKEIEQDYTENICKILGVTATHLGVLLFRAKDKLRKCMEGKLGADLS